MNEEQIRQIVRDEIDKYEKEKTRKLMESLKSIPYEIMVNDSNKY